MTDPAPMTPRTDALLDRIIDGDLSPAELRRAIDRLESEPDGWKRCALAFLEAQCWRESFQRIDAHSPALREGAGRFRPPSPLPQRSSAAWRRFALAAGIAGLAFVLGWTARPDRIARPPGSGIPPALDIVDRSERPESLPARETTAAVEPSPDDGVFADPMPPIRTVGRMRLGSTDNSPTVPILAGPGIDDDWVKNQPLPITEHEQALLEQKGYEVDQFRRLITGRLGDGRIVEIPVDRVQLRYKGITSL
jgi:hypothetical protein